MGQHLDAAPQHVAVKAWLHRILFSVSIHINQLSFRLCKMFCLFFLFLPRGLWTWLPWVICASAFDHKIGNAAHSGVSEVFFFTKSYKWKKQRWKKWTNGRQCDFENLQRCANSRWLTDGSDHNRNYNFSMWPDNDLSVLCYFLAAIPSLKVS